MKKIKRLLLVVVMLFAVTGCKSLFTYENEKIEYLTGKQYIEMSVKDYGIIKMELDADIAPISVTTVMNLVKEKFYDGNTLHRIYKDFVIQGGRDLEGGHSTIKGEFDANGVSNDITHVRGTVSMARAGGNTSGFDTASTQFFIVVKDSTFLDHYYAGIGKVTEGMDVVDKIVEKVTNVNSNGEVLDESDMPIIEYIKEIEK